jgi:UPF0755 protein
MQDTDPDRGRALHDDDRATDDLPWPEARGGRSDGGGGAPAGLPGPRRRKRRLIVRILALAFLALLGFIAYRAYTFVDGTFLGSAPPPGKLVTVTIPKGSGVGAIGDILDRAGVVSNGQAWALKVRLESDGNGLRPGVYRLRQHEHYTRLIAELDNGPTAPAGSIVRFLVPEGLRIRDIAQRAQRLGMTPTAYRNAVAHAAPPKGFRPTGSEQVTMEGFLWPATYELRTPVRPATLVREQLAAFRRNVAKVDFTAARRKNLTPYDVLIIASLIEREAAYPPERAKIAAVIYNRLHRGMPLQIDATVQYALGSWKPITQADTHIASEFNTYRHDGLPPTPISNPGLASLQAAAHPAKVPYLYYVAIPGDPKHRSFFTDSYPRFVQFQQQHRPR